MMINPDPIVLPQQDSQSTNHDPSKAQANLLTKQQVVSASPTLQLQAPLEMIQELQEKSRLSCDGSAENDEHNQFKAIPETESFDYTVGTQSMHATIPGINDDGNTVRQSEHSNPTIPVEYGTYDITKLESPGLSQLKDNATGSISGSFVEGDF